MMLLRLLDSRAGLSAGPAWLRAERPPAPITVAEDAGPRLAEAAAGRPLRRGDSGPAVLALKRELAALGYAVTPGDRFDRETRRAVRDFQAATGCQVDGLVGPETLGALGLAPATAAPAIRRAHGAPRFDAPAPAGSVKAGRLAGGTARPPAKTDPRRPERAEGPRQAASVARTAESGAADERLAAHQARAVEVAEGELAQGVKEDPPGSNRHPRIDRYAESAGMKIGGEWCGYFANYAYTAAAEAAGGKFTGQKKLHSVEKNVAWFAYYDYTGKKPRDEKKADGERLRADHAAAGSTRRLMVIEGSKAEKYVEDRGLPHETHRDPSALPIRPGDTVLWEGHIGLVKSYDPATGRLVTLEGNTNGGRVAEKVHDLSSPEEWARLQGFGRPAEADFLGGT